MGETFFNIADQENRVRRLADDIEIPTGLDILYLESRSVPSLLSLLMKADNRIRSAAGEELVNLVEYANSFDMVLFSNQIPPELVEKIPFFLKESAIIVVFDEFPGEYFWFQAAEKSFIQKKFSSLTRFHLSQQDRKSFDSTLSCLLEKITAANVWSRRGEVFSKLCLEKTGSPGTAVTQRVIGTKKK